MGRDRTDAQFEYALNVQGQWAARRNAAANAKQAATGGAIKAKAAADYATSGR